MSTYGPLFCSLIKKLDSMTGRISHKLHKDNNRPCTQQQYHKSHEAINTPCHSAKRHTVYYIQY